MNYSLAKKLKEARFPSSENSGLFFDEDKNFIRTTVEHWSDGEIGDTRMPGMVPSDIYVPTLSELIEACGNKFHSLTRFNNVFVSVAVNMEARQMGKSPEEAVANLWLKLQEK